VEYLRSLELSRDELTKAIIGTMGDIDAYQLPDAKGYSALVRHLLGVTDEERQIRRDQILSTSNQDFKWVPAGVGVGRWVCDIVRGSSILV
jgi:Zn-dependent M16 (insulinase) family peptidase